MQAKLPERESKPAYQDIPTQGHDLYAANQSKSQSTGWDVAPFQKGGELSAYAHRSPFTPVSG